MKEEQLLSPGVLLLPAPANRSSWVALDLGHVLPFGSQLHRPYVRSSHVIGLRRLFVNLSRVQSAQITFFSNNERTGIQFAAIGELVLRRFVEEASDTHKAIPLDWFLQKIPN